ncbi:MAG: hypothetical protein JSR54_19700, partial [Proteobacteria bacterium]|nr:hypothetical protein [Pseudomonadota bacterium]
MNFLAILIALVAERLVAASEALRAPLLLLGYARAALRAAARDASTALPAAVLAALLPGIAV